MREPPYDLAIIGAGPAGLSAAVLAAGYGASVIVLDEHPQPGGQIYRNITRQSSSHLALLGADYAKGIPLVERFQNSKARYLPGTRVWMLNEQKQIGIVHENQCQIISAKQIIIASGAMERPVPFPGWTLPGVMNAGAAQILFKSSRLVPGPDVVLAGMGPLLLLLAWQYLQAGIRVKKLLDFTPWKNRIKAIPHLPSALLAHKYLKKGLALEWSLKKAGVEILRGVESIEAQGTNSLEQIEFQHAGDMKTLKTNQLLVHFGVIPVNQLSQNAGCQHVWHEGQQCWLTEIDEWGQTSVTGIYIAGDGAHIAGAENAEYSGQLSALHACSALGKISPSQANQLAKPIRKQLKRDAKIRPFLEALFRVPENLLIPKDENTIVCRCEEVSLRQIKLAIALGLTDPNQIKFFTRCGMGPCQGRQCSQAVAHIAASENNTHIADMSPYRARAPINRLSLQELASLSPEETE